MPHTERFEKLLALSPVEAVRAWLNGDFGIGDEEALFAAIRKDPRVTWTDTEITEIMFVAMDEEWDAETCFQRMIGPAPTSGMG